MLAPTAIGKSCVIFYQSWDIYFLVKHLGVAICDSLTQRFCAPVTTDQAITPKYYTDHSELEARSLGEMHSLGTTKEIQMLC